MSFTTRRLVRRARIYHSDPETELSFLFSRLLVHPRHSFHSSSRRNAVPKLHHEESKSKRVSPTASADLGVTNSQQLKKAPVITAKDAAARARAKLQAQQEKARGQLQFGGLADNSIFAEDEKDSAPPSQLLEIVDDSPGGKYSLARRNPTNMAAALDPAPDARIRWMRKMVMRDIRRRGRLTKVVRIARTERSHLAKSHFFKTSMKKLAPLARQIAGKSIDEAILQMRFSNKKVARDVRRHLIQARDEAIVMRGMGLEPKQLVQNPKSTPILTLPDIPKSADNKSSEAAALNEDGLASPSSSKLLAESNSNSVDSPLLGDPSITPYLPTQNALKRTKSDSIKPTDIYISQAWVNRGPYGQSIPDFRAMGRVNFMRPPHAGISILLKEETTRTREKNEKEEKAIRKRLGKTMWTQLPDRKVVRQSQYVLW